MESIKWARDFEELIGNKVSSIFDIIIPCKYTQILYL